MSHPVKQGFVQSLGVFVDTMIICTSTAFIILVSGPDVYDPANTGGIAGATLTQAAVAAAPSYAPPGRRLVQLTALTAAGVTDRQALSEAGRLWRTATTEWELLVRHDISNALPLTRPPLQLRRAVDLGDGIYLCGDHQDTPSIQGAMASGHRTAIAVSRLLDVA